MTLLQADQLLAEFADKVNLQNLSFNNDGLCHLVVNDDSSLSLRYNPDKNAITLFSELPSVTPQNITATWMKFILNSAFNSFHENEPGVGQHPDSDSLVAFIHFDLNHLTVDLLELAVVDFIEWKAEWISKEQSIISQQASPISTSAPSQSLRV